MDLFGNYEQSKKVFRRDSVGRFAGEKQAKFVRALREAAFYKNMYLYSESRMKGIYKILRQKDNLINKLKGGYNVDIL